MSIIIIIVIIESIVLINLIKESFNLFFLKKKTLIPCKENIFLKESLFTRK